MNENELLAKIGRQHLLLEKQDEAYGQLLQLLAQVVRGDVDRSRVMVNLTAKGWMVAPEGFRPDLPATINGLPFCVVAPVRAPEPEPEKAPEAA